MLSQILDAIANNPARVRAALLMAIVSLVGEVDRLFDALGVDETLWGFDLGWVAANEPLIDKAIMVAGIFVLVACGRMSIHELVMPTRKIEDIPGGNHPVWRADGGE